MAKRKGAVRESNFRAVVKLGARENDSGWQRDKLEAQRSKKLAKLIQLVKRQGYEPVVEVVDVGNGEQDAVVTLQRAA